MVPEIRLVRNSGRRLSPSIALRVRLPRQIEGNSGQAVLFYRFAVGSVLYNQGYLRPAERTGWVAANRCAGDLEACAQLEGTSPRSYVAVSWCGGEVTRQPSV